MADRRTSSSASSRPIVTCKPCGPRLELSRITYRSAADHREPRHLDQRGLVANSRARRSYHGGIREPRNHASISAAQGQRTNWRCFWAWPSSGAAPARPMRALDGLQRPHADLLFRPGLWSAPRHDRMGTAARGDWADRLPDTDDVLRRGARRLYSSSARLRRVGAIQHALPQSRGERPSPCGLHQSPIPIVELALATPVANNFGNRPSRKACTRLARGRTVSAAWGTVIAILASACRCGGQLSPCPQ